MSITKVKIVTFALMTFLVISWVQPSVGHACSAMPMENDTAFSTTITGMDDACIFMQKAEGCHSTAAQGGSGYDASPQIPAGKLCTMKVCFQAYSTLIAQHFDFFIIPAKAEFIALQRDICIPSFHLSGLFRPPRFNATPLGITPQA